MMSRVGVGLIGFGTVGSGVVKILLENAGLIRRRVGVPIELVRVADLDVTRDRGGSPDRPAEKRLGSDNPRRQTPRVAEPAAVTLPAPGSKRWREGVSVQKEKVSPGGGKDARSREGK